MEEFIAMKTLTNILLTLIALSFILPSCKEERKSYVSVTSNPDSIQTMVTRDVVSLISDSGMTRYRILSKLWLVYDEAKVPTWKFPVGLKLEQFDDSFRIAATVKCDSATYFKNQKLWRLDGHVDIRNIKKEVIETEQIFWDQVNHKVYSDSFVHIERADRILEGYGFTSNEKLTEYVIRRPSGIIPVPERKDTTAQN